MSCFSPLQLFSSRQRGSLRPNTREIRYHESLHLLQASLTWILGPAVPHCRDIKLGTLQCPGRKTLPHQTPPLQLQQLHIDLLVHWGFLSKKSQSSAPSDASAHTHPSTKLTHRPGGVLHTGDQRHSSGKELDAMRRSRANTHHDRDLLEIKPEPSLPHGALTQHR